jgi:hypothetical protein
MKTSELRGPALDWAVAKCEGWPMDIWFDEDQMPMIRDDEVPEWKPSTDWAQGGPIIERENIEVFRRDEQWFAYSSLSKPQDFHGRTPLEAAMRCYVASKMGDEIEVPEELGAPA